MSPWQWHIYQLYYQKVEVCVVRLLAVGDQRIKGFREKSQILGLNKARVFMSGLQTSTQFLLVYTSIGSQMIANKPAERRWEAGEVAAL